MICQLSSFEKYLASTTRHGNMLETGIRSMQKMPSLQYKESAFVMITCEDYHDTSIIEALQSIPEVKEIQYTYGNYDIVIKVETDTADSMRDVIECGIRKIPRILATTTLISSPILIS